MSMQPTWFGRDAPRFGWLHVPETGEARGAVVCCPPLGTEGLGAHWALRRLADELAAAGFLVLRFDYRGSGDSSGAPEGVTSLDCWLEDVAEAIAYARASGAGGVSLLGLRLGAALAARAAALDGAVEALVLWDPCTGRAFVREQKALKLLSSGPSEEPANGDVELLAMVLTKPLNEELRGFRFEAPNGGFAEAVLVLERPERPTEPSLAQALAGQPHDRLPAEGQHEFIDVEPGESRLPEQTLKSIRQWLDDRLPTAAVPFELALQSEAIVPVTPELSVRERALVLQPSGIAAIVTEPLGLEPPEPGPLHPTGEQRTAFFLNAGLIHRIGPAGLWVTLARRLAAGGLRAVRFDLTGIGDSAGDATARVAYTPQAIDDVTSVVDAFCAERRQAVLVGLCSGSYHAAEAGIAGGVGTVCLLNPATFWFDPDRVRVPGAAREPAVPELGVNPIARWMRRQQWLLELVAWGPIDRLRNGALAARVDEWGRLWQWLDHLGIVRSPVRVLDALAARNVDVLLVCGPFESKPFARWEAGTRALEQRGQLRYERFDFEDHSLFESRFRNVARDLVLDHLLHPRSERLLAARPAPEVERAAGRAPAERRRAQVAELLAGSGLLGRFFYLVATQLVTVLLGLVYWTTVARLVPADQVGLASTAMFSAMLIGALGVLGITSLMLVQLGQVGPAERRALVSTGVVGSALVTGAIAFGVWAASGWLGPSFHRIGANPAEALLFVLGTGIQTAVTVLDAVAIGLKRGPVQLARNLVAAGLKVAFAAGVVLLGVRTTTGLLGAWDLSLLASIPIVPPLLRLHREAPRSTFRQRLALVRRYGGLSMRHHALNVALSTMGFFLPVVAAMFAAPQDMAYFSMAQVVSGCALLLPFMLTMSLFVESSGNEAVLRANLRRTLPVGLACCLGLLALGEPFGGVVLSMFGKAYVAHGLLPFRLLLLGGLPYVAKDHFVAVRRAQERLGEAARVGAISTGAEIAAAALGGAFGGLDGLCLGWLCCTVLEAGYFAPKVLAVLRAAPAPTRASRALPPPVVRVVEAAEPSGYLSSPVLVSDDRRG